MVDCTIDKFDCKQFWKKERLTRNQQWPKAFGYTAKAIVVTIVE